MLLSCYKGYVLNWTIYCIGQFKFATSKLSGEELFSMTWNVIEQAEGASFKVMVITADGAAANRKFVKMHQDPTGGNVANDGVYKINNILLQKREVSIL